MTVPYVLTFPMYALLLKDGSGTIFLRHGTDLLLPLFTEDTNVLAYAAKTQLGDCIAAEMASAADVAAFVQNPPSRGGKGQVSIIVLDPIDNQPRSLVSWTLPDFLALLAMH